MVLVDMIDDGIIEHILCDRGISSRWPTHTIIHYNRSTAIQKYDEIINIVVLK